MESSEASEARTSVGWEWVEWGQEWAVCHPYQLPKQSRRKRLIILAFAI